MSLKKEPAASLTRERPGHTRWRRLKTIVADALEIAIHERDAFLDAACDGDSGLRAEAVALLNLENEAEQMLGPALSHAGFLDASMERTRVGPYLLREPIAEGGMGVVYLAEREDASFRRTVAVKLLRRGLVDSETIRRFENERQILATIDHPNIAKLYDGGTTPEGYPFLVMEYIDGEPLDQYCSSRALGVEDRLVLFGKVCAAVDMAHQNLVIHRDLKPGNILVTADGEPKLLDFGIAKLLDSTMVDATPGITREGRPFTMMTLEYASPEQARNEPVTTRSDVYSLGVLLHELLTGQRPFDFTGLDWPKVIQTIGEVEPPRPSAAVTANEAAAKRAGVAECERLGDGVKLARVLAGDLDNIVMKALRKEPGRRYGGVAALSADVQRHLERRPVEARPATLTYRTGRFFQRNRTASAAASVVLLSLSAFLVLTHRSRVQAESARAVAEVEAVKATAVKEFLQSLLAAANVARGGQGDVTVRDAIGAAAERIDRAFAGQPDVEASVRTTIGTTLVSLADYEAAKPQLERALAIRVGLYGPRHPDVASSYYSLGLLSYQAGDYETARSHLENAASLQTEPRGSEHPELTRTLRVLAAAADAQGRRDDAERIVTEAVRVARASADPLLGSLLTLQAGFVSSRGDRQSGEAHYREAVAVLRESESPDLPAALDGFGNFLIDDGALEEAESLLRESRVLLEIRDSPLGLARNERIFADLHAARGEHDAAARAQRSALETFRELLGDDHAEVGLARHRYAKSLLALGDAAGATDELRRAHSILSTTLGEAHPSTLQVTRALEALRVASDVR